MADLWNDGGTWNWGLPIRIAGDPLGAGQSANVATGMSAFVTPDNVDHIVYIRPDVPPLAEPESTLLTWVPLSGSFNCRRGAHQPTRVRAKKVFLG
jgi:hypothetical protein